HDDHIPIFIVSLAFHALFTAAISDFVNELTCCTRSRPFPYFAIWLTIALPTTTASEQAATTLACSGVEMPKPTAVGSLVCKRIFAVIWAMFSDTFCCIPVTPSRET